MNSKLLIIDNYDSFTYNIERYVNSYIGVSADVIKNDDTIPDNDYIGVIISPGPGTPEDPSSVGCAKAVLDNFHGPILGVCLGHQYIAHYFGGKISLMKEPMHGRISTVDNYKNCNLLSLLPERFDVTRYHSLYVEQLPDCIVETSSTGDGVIQSIKHASRPIFGVQYHPESVTSEYGGQIIYNFITICLNERKLYAENGRGKICTTA
ncbi:anthranilate synthase component II [Motilimonas sp. 1_MG-2023]|uniref:anthranilate synthase component II n=1 Tax=Motilimonas TaxID=1914248 RepID=UPI0026E1E21D|nr:aminodeoxychorismate/anthranilate synthase component II [Motilimonas sp. 1_MG-2023]MDO6525262.1 aminodeoxychorismate/anthranilate synthase component II [Motilimonas sp. 1_MG-2023]